MGASTRSSADGGTYQDQVEVYLGPEHNVYLEHSDSRRRLQVLQVWTWCLRIKEIHLSILIRSECSDVRR